MADNWERYIPTKMDGAIFFHSVKNLLAQCRLLPQQEEDDNIEWTAVAPALQEASHARDFIRLIVNGASAEYNSADTWAPSPCITVEFGETPTKTRDLILEHIYVVQERGAKYFNFHDKNRLNLDTVIRACIALAKRPELCTRNQIIPKPNELNK